MQPKNHLERIQVVKDIFTSLVLEANTSCTWFHAMSIVTVGLCDPANFDKSRYMVG